MKVFLIGFMASGKTTIGERLAQELGYNFIDLDGYIEQKEGKTIKELFEIRGEEHFRSIESEALRDVSKLDDNHVIASGGGTSCFYNSVDFMNKVGITIYLKAEIPELLARLIKAKNNRPLLWGKNEEELNRYIARVLNERKKYYEKARITVSINQINIQMLAKTIRAIQS